MRITPCWIVLVLLRLALSAHAIGFAKVENISPTILLGDIHWFDADANGITDVVAIDAHRGRLVARLRYAGGGSTPSVSDPWNFIDLGGPDFDSVYTAIGEADLDGDGDPDIYAQIGSEIHWWGSTTGGLVHQGVWYDFSDSAVALELIADIDGDGKLDLVTEPLSVYYSSQVPKLSRIAFGNASGGFTWVEYPSAIAAFVSSFQGCRKVIDMEGDGFTDLLGYDRIVRFRGRELIETIPHSGLTPTKVAGIQHTVFIKSTVGVDALAAYSLVRYVPGTGWEQIGDSVPAFDLMHRPERGLKHVQVVGGAFDDEKNGCCAIIMEQSSHSLLPPAVDSLVLLLAYDGLRLRIISGTHYLGSANRLSWFSAGVRSSSEPDLLVGRRSTIEGFDIFGNPVIISALITEGIALSPSPRIVSISYYHEPRAFAMVEAGSVSSRRVISAGGADGSLVSWGGSLFSSTPTSSGIGLPALSMVAGGQHVAGVTDVFISMVSESAQTPHDPFVFREATEQRIKAMYMWEETSMGFFPQHLVGVSDLDGDGTMDILHIDPQTGSLVSRRVIASAPGGAGQLAPGARIVITPAVVPFQGQSPASQTGDNTLLYDMDGDGDKDILRYPSLYGHRLAIHWNDGGSFSRHEPLGVESEGLPQGMLIGNFNGSGSQIATWESAPPDSDGGAQTAFRVHSMQGAELRSSLIPGEAMKIRAGDFDGDGLDDIAVATKPKFDIFGNPLAYSGVSILVNHGSRFSKPMSLLIPGAGILDSILAQDFDSDGLVDLLIGNRDGQIMHLRALSSNLLAESYGQWAARLGVSENGEGDGDRDGASDLFEYATGSNPHLAEDTGSHGIEPLITTGLEFYPPEWINGADENPVIGFSTSSVQFPVRADSASDIIRVSVERSYDLMKWEMVGDPLGGSLIPGVPGWRLLARDSFPSGPVRKGGGFYRFRVDLESEYILLFCDWGCACGRWVLAGRYGYNVRLRDGDGCFLRAG